MTKLNLYNNDVDIKQGQDIYDSFNSFIFSKDRNVFNKLYSRYRFYEMVKHRGGDIVECGVFKGSGIATWLKILEVNEPNSIKKVIGFDFFGNDFLENLEGIDKDTMKEVFTRCNATNSDLSVSKVTERIIASGFSADRFELVEGDITQTAKQYSTSKPGFRISILYLDLDLEEPTYNALTAFWDNIVEGGVIVFDEYGYHNWSESAAVDRFCREKGLAIITTGVKAPTAYTIKITK